MKQKSDFMKIYDSLMMESPIYIDTDLPFSPISSILNRDLHDGYNLIGTTESGVHVFVGVSGGFIAGNITDNGLDVLIRVHTSRLINPSKPHGLNNPVQVNMVSVVKEISGTGIGTSVYNIIAANYDLIADYTHYKGAKRLWKAIAKSGVVNVYMYDSNNREYIKYTGKNIDDSKIWGSDDENMFVMLIATKKELQ